MFMRKLFFVLVILVVSSCQIEDKSAPKPIESFIRYFGAEADHTVADLEPVWNEDSSDVTGFVLLGSSFRLGQGQTQDYYVAITDAGGNLLQDTSFGFNYFIDDNFRLDDVPDNLTPDSLSTTDVASKIITLQGGGFLVIGTSSFTGTVIRDTLNNQSSQIAFDDYKFVTYAFLDENLGLVGGRVHALYNDSSDHESQLDLVCNDVIQLDEGNFVIVGQKELAGGELQAFARKMSFSQGVFDQSVWQDGVGPIDRVFGLNGSDDEFMNVFERNNGDLVALGNTDDRGEEGERGSNISFFRLNSEGLVVRSNAHGVDDPPGTTSEDVMNNAIVKPAGYAIVGTSTVDGRERAFFMDIDDNGTAFRRVAIDSEFSTGTTPLQTRGFGITATLTNDFVLAGQYPSFVSGGQSRSGEAMFMRLNQIGEKVAGNEANFGVVAEDDVAVDVITLPDGKIVMLANISFDRTARTIALIKLNDDGSLDN